MVRPAVAHALFAMSNNECAFSGCASPIFDPISGTLVGEICHIRAQSPGGPRYVATLELAEMHGLANLLLLCSTHHKIVDDHPDDFPVVRLEEMKAQHEARAEPIDRTRLLAALTALGALVVAVPDDWWRRPGAPSFRLDLGSSRPRGAQWTLEATIFQIRGEDIGDLKARFAGDMAETELAPPRFDGNRHDARWRLPGLNLTARSLERMKADAALGLDGPNFAIEMRFWWAGEARGLLFVWPSVDAFQDEQPEIRYLQGDRFIAVG